MSATENTSRNAFGINGILGMLIATALLLTILFVLVSWSIKVQKAEASHFYDPAPIVNSLDNIKMKSTDNAKFAFQEVKEEKKK